ncbi:GNAT family N-acetyltransferase [Enterococcus sp. HY326]|uniref:GNAT family N-acetyltransferase n=1 Tax=Enterococcus sp. HY326 TaxID=2971265 RepID=UPI00223ECDF8|nr:GNAT family N-acetyltransferase [Enterococcus sp. HY326]
MLVKKRVQTPAEVTQLLPELQEIWQEVFTPIIGAEQVTYMLQTYQSKENILAEIARGVEYYLLFNQEKVVGYTAFDFQGEQLYLSKIYLKAASRGQGLSSELFAWYEEVARKAGIKKLYLRVNQHNQQAVAVYQHKGFQLIKTQVDEIGVGFVMEDYIFEKSLD